MPLSLVEAPQTSRDPIPEVKARPPLVEATARIFRSTFFWIIVALVALDVLLRAFLPLKTVAMGGRIPMDRHPGLIKFARFQRPLYRPDLIMVGSSLCNSALAGADVFCGFIPGAPWEKFEHTEPIYFSQGLSRLIGCSLSVFDFYLPGSMASDAELVTEKALTIHPETKVLIYAATPRDFFDNDGALEPEDSTVARFLADSSVKEIGIDALQSPSRFQSLLASFWHFLKVRADYRACTYLLTCQFLHHNDDPFVLSLGLRPGEPWVHFHKRTHGVEKSWDRAMKLKDAADYRRRYHPFNEKLCNTQFEYFDRILSTCQKRGIIPIVVDLPVPPEHLAQIDGTVNDMFRERMKDTCAKYNANFIEMQKDPSFVEGDFVDSLHISAPGSKKLIDKLLIRINENTNLREQLRTALNQ